MQILFNLLTALLFSTGAPLEQNIGGTVLYKSELIITDDSVTDLKTTDPQRYRKFIAFSKEIAEAVEQIEYTLIFNDKVSLFKAEEMLSKDSDMLDGLQKSVGIYYNNISGERIQQVKDQDRIYLIKRKPLEWEITGETKQIAGYTCKKAVSTENFFSHRTKENKVQEIEAWFAPNIPVSYGPKGYSGLPGLILDLRVAQEHIYSTEIDLNIDRPEIRKPAKGRKVSFEEYQAIRAGLDKKFKEFYGN